MPYDPDDSRRKPVPSPQFRGSHFPLPDGHTTPVSGRNALARGGQFFFAHEWTAVESARWAYSLTEVSSSANLSSVSFMGTTFPFA